MVVWTQTSVVQPLNSRWVMPRARSTWSRSVWVKAPFAVLSMMMSSGRTGISGTIPWPGDDRSRIREQYSAEEKIWIQWHRS